MKRLFLALLFALGPYSSTLAMDLNFEDHTAWQPMPTWTGAPTAYPLSASANSQTMFAVVEPYKQMKWTHAVPATEKKDPYLVFRYMVRNLDNQGEYVLWVFTSDGGYDLVRGDELIADGAWHTAFLDLHSRGIHSPITTVAINVRAGAMVPAYAWFDYIHYTDELPQNARLLQ